MSDAAAVTALVGRDLTALRRSRSQLYSSVLFPLMLLAIIGSGVSDGLDPRRVDDYVTFLVPGIIVMTALFSSTFSSASYYQDRDSGMLNVILAAPLSSRTVMLGKALSGVVIGALQAAIVLGVGAAVPAVNFEWQYGTVPSLALAAYGILMLCFFLAGIGQALASRIQSMQGFHLVMNLVLFPFLFFSGAFFPLDDLPLWLRVIGMLNPLSYVVDLLQLALYASSDAGYFGLTIDLIVITAMSVAVFAFGAGRAASSTR